MSSKYQTTYALPGQPLGVDSEYQAGPGTYLSRTLRPSPNKNEDQKVITSALAGRVFILHVDKSEELPIIAILKPMAILGGTGDDESIRKERQIRAALLSSGPDNGELAGVGDTVLARVTRIGVRQATVAILVVENATFTNNIDNNTGEDYSGIIRSQDIRQFDRDEPNLVPTSFRPGDLIRAQVLSLGDGNNYYLSTAADNLGVIFAKCSEDDQDHKGRGEIMYPIDWMHMKCPKSGHVETRKCAKPI